MLEGVELQRLGGDETCVRRETQGLVDHRFAAHAYQYLPVKGSERVQLPEAGIIRFHASAETQSGIQDPVGGITGGEKAEAGIIAREGEHVRHTESGYEIVHLVVPAGDIIDDHGPEPVQSLCGDRGTEGVDREGGIRERLANDFQRRRQPPPFFLLRHRSTARTRGARADIQNFRPVKQGLFCP